MSTASQTPNRCKLSSPRRMAKAGKQEAIERAIEGYIPQVVELQVPVVLGVGWRRRETVSGAEFRFTDGALLNYYRGKDTLSIQGKPGPLPRAALEALPSHFWPGLDALSDTLKQLFPDWQLGGASHIRPYRGTETSEMAEDASRDEAHQWSAFWPKGYDMRLAANKKAPCQRALMNDWAAILAHRDRKRHLLAQAPTGLGKTVAALVPALAWVAEAPERRRVYYLVNRVTQHDNPIRELSTNLAAIFEAQTSQPLHLVDIVGRRWLCRHPKTRRLPPLCKDSRKTAHFGLLPEGVASWQEVNDHLGEDRCPYHTLQGLMSQAHLVISDYWWLFSQMAQENDWLVRAGFSSTDTIVVVDEAHNLPARVREELDVDESTERLIAEIRKAPFEVPHCLMPIIKAVQQVDPEVGISPSALLPAPPLSPPTLGGIKGGESMVSAALKRLSSDEPEEGYTKLSEQILRLLLRPDEEVVIYPTNGMQDEKRLVFRLVDPIPVLERGYARVHASLSMSGTLGAPTDDYRELRYQVPLFGLPRSETLTRTYASPFPSRNQMWFFNPDTYGTYSEGSKHLTHYAQQIVKVGEKTPSVTAVFFSSYDFLAAVTAKITDSEESLIVAEKQQDAEEADSSAVSADYEQQLRSRVDEHGRAYLFAVYKGRLAEGADFPQNLIKTVIGISIPLEYPSLYHKRLRELFAEHCTPIAEELGDELSKKAQEYTRDRLSLSLVLQACGRGIRDKKDRCAFVLLDKRYEKYDWRRFLESKPYNVSQIARRVDSFHKTRQTPTSGGWDTALLDACRQGDE